MVKVRVRARVRVRNSVRGMGRVGVKGDRDLIPHAHGVVRYVVCSMIPPCDDDVCGPLIASPSLSLSLNPNPKPNPNPPLGAWAFV